MPRTVILSPFASLRVNCAKKMRITQRRISSTRSERSVDLRVRFAPSGPLPEYRLPV